jgi:hypothetical protein
MAKVAVIGGDITRDLWPAHRRRPADFLHISRTTLPSLLSAAPAGVATSGPRPRALTLDQQDAVVADIRKTSLGDLVAFRPTHLILDLVDERFDLLVVDGAVVTRSAELVASGYLERAPLSSARRVPRLSAACDRLWREAAREFAELVAATPLATATLILHVFRWANQDRTLRGDIARFEGVEDAEAHNALVAGYEAELAARFPALRVVNAPAARIADRARLGDLGPLQCGPAYSGEIRRQLGELGIAFSGAPAAPNAPGA